MKTNHTMIADPIFCKKNEAIVSLTPEFYGNCFQCKFFNGSGQGDGVDCLFDDGSDAFSKTYTDAKKAQKELDK
jgi:hypothetical protein